MATIKWSGKTGDWATAANWVGGKAPGASDAAVFGAGTFVAKVEENDSVQSVTLAAAAGTVAVYAGHVLTVGSTFTISSGNTLELAGELKGGVLETNTSGFVAQGGTLNGVTLAGRIEVDATMGKLHLAGPTVTLADYGDVGTGAIEVNGSQSVLYMDGGLTLTTGDIDLGNASSAGHGAVLVGDFKSGTYAMQVLGVSTEVFQNGKYAEINVSQANDCIYNLGEVLGSYAGGQFVITGPGTFASDGNMTIEDGDTLTAAGAVFRNSGFMYVGGAGSVAVFNADTFTNLGAIDVRSGGKAKIVSANFTNFSNSPFGGRLVGGELEVGAGAAVILPNNDFIHTLEAEVYLSGAGSVVQSYDTATKANVTLDQSLRTIAGGGDLTMSSGRTMTIAGAVTNNGDINLETASLTVTSLENNDYLDGNGTMSGTIDNNRNIYASDGMLKLVGKTGVTSVSKGSMWAYNGGTLNFAGGTMNSLAGFIYVYDGGTISLTAGAVLQSNWLSIAAMGALIIGNGASLQAQNTLMNFGKLSVSSSTLAADIEVLSPGVTLSGGGTVTLVGANAQIIGASATATLTNVDNRIAGSGQLGDGVMTLVNQAAGSVLGNQTVGLTINTGGAVIANAGLIENDNSGGVMVQSKVNNAGTLLAAVKGTLTLAGAVSGAGVGQIDGGTLYAKSTFVENVTFTGTTGVLELALSTAYTGTVAGLSTKGTNSLDLLDIAFASGTTKASFSGTTAGGTLTVTDGTHTAKIKLMGNYLGSTFTVASDGHGGTSVKDPVIPAAPLVQAMAATGSARAGMTELVRERPPGRLPMLHAQA